MVIHLLIDRQCLAQDAHQIFLFQVFLSPVNKKSDKTAFSSPACFSISLQSLLLVLYPSMNPVNWFCLLLSLTVNLVIAGNKHQIRCYTCSSCNEPQGGVSPSVMRFTCQPLSDFSSSTCSVKPGYSAIEKQL